MKKLFTLCVSFLLLGAVASAQNVDQTFQFVDAQGNVVADGSTIVVNTLNEAGQMVVPLSVKNMSGQRAAVSMYETIGEKPNGDWQTCAFGNCMILNESGYSPKNIVAADYNESIQTEWIPVEGGYATWEATLQIHVFNIVSKTQFEVTTEQAGTEIIGYGPTVKVKFEYKEAAASQKVWWGYVNADDHASVGGLGVNAADTYHCAIFIPGNHAVAAGKTIDAIRFTINTNNVTGVKAWVSTTKPASIDQAAVVVDVTSSDYTGMVEATLPQPYTIPASGVYVGYSFTVPTLQSQADSYPIAIVAAGDMANALIIKTDSTVPTWSDMNGQGFGRLFLQVQLEGEFPDNAVTPADMGYVVVKSGETATARLTLSSAGSSDVTSIGYTITTDGVASAEQELTLTNPLTFNSSATVDLPIAADAAVGNKEKTLTVTKVNGVANNAGKTTATFTLVTTDVIPEKAVAVEEFTGTGCGWCPRGLVGMEKLANTFGNRFVGIGIHQYNSGDAMYIARNSYAPLSFGGAPSCSVNRKYETDPYYGTGNSIIDDVADELSIPALAGISATAKFNADSTKVEASAEAFSIVEGQNLKVEFVLIGDGLKGTGASWNQSNYYYQYTTSQLPSDLAKFGNGGKYGSSTITGWVFNDVALTSSYVSNVNKAQGFSNMALGQTYTSQYTLSLPTKASLLNALKKDQLFVAVLLIGDDGTVANAIRVPVEAANETGGIATAAITSDTKTVYNLNGRRQPAVQKGLNIVRMADGTVRKVMVK